MFRNRIHYWTCSKVADFIRGEKKPYALEWDKWREYYADLKKRKPIRYWITEELLRKLQNIVYYPYDLYSNIKGYIRNRWIDKTHYLKTGLKPGGYYEFDERILHGLFNELVDYVEMELAHLSKWDTTKHFTFKNGRSIEAAYDYFEWANNLTCGKDYGILPDHEDYGKLTDQAIKSRKIRELYEWWTITRPNRDDPLMSITKESHGKKYYQLINDIEESYYNEDTEMLTDLIKIRNCLWT